jgi:hypothetical protein
MMNGIATIVMQMLMTLLKEKMYTWLSTNNKIFSLYAAKFASNPNRIGANQSKFSARTNLDEIIKYKLFSKIYQ